MAYRHALSMLLCAQQDLSFVLDTRHYETRKVFAYGDFLFFCMGWIAMIPLLFLPDSFSRVLFSSSLHTSDGLFLLCLFVSSFFCFFTSVPECCFQPVIDPRDQDLSSSTLFNGLLRHSMPAYVDNPERWVTQDPRIQSMLVPQQKRRPHHPRPIIFELCLSRVSMNACTHPLDWAHTR